MAAAVGCEGKGHMGCAVCHVLVPIGEKKGKFPSLLVFRGLVQSLLSICDVIPIEKGLFGASDRTQGNQSRV